MDTPVIISTFALLFSALSLIFTAYNVLRDKSKIKAWAEVYYDLSKDMDNPPPVLKIRFVRNNNDLLIDQPNWQQTVESAKQNLTTANKLITQSRIQFHSALPHNFLDEKISINIDNSFLQCINKIEKLQSQIDMSAQRIFNITKYFE